jgi:hypothetical protein
VRVVKAEEMLESWIRLLLLRFKQKREGGRERQLSPEDALQIADSRDSAQKESSMKETQGRTKGAGGSDVTFSPAYTGLMGTSAYNLHKLLPVNRVRGMSATQI